MLTGQIRQNTTNSKEIAQASSDLTTNYILTFYLQFNRALNKNKTLHAIEIQKYPMHAINFCTAIAFVIYFNYNIQWLFQ